VKYIDPDPLDDAVERLLAEMQALSRDPECVVPDKLERLAKAVSIHLKAINDVNAHNGRVAKADEDKKYLSYEDLPPPTPEERARLIDRVQLLYDRVNAGQPVSDLPENDPGPSSGAPD